MGLTRRKNMPVVMLLSIGYFTTIILATILLMLPFASREGHTSFIDAVLTATSATCVTGLIAFDTAAHWTLFGQIVIMLAIQIGGLGFMTIITLLFMVIKRNIGLYNRTVIMQSAGSYNISGTTKLIRRIILGTLAFEAIGAVLIYFSIKDTYTEKTWYYAIFHSISAFCNAGFDVFGAGSGFAPVSLTPFSHNYGLLFTLMGLIIIGGSGFIVWSDIIDSRFKWSRFQVHTKIVVVANSVLIAIPAILFFIFEFTKVGTNAAFADMPFWDKIVNALFMSVTPRTAGFNSVDLNSMTASGQLLTVFLMLIGGNSGSTAGGVKVTTIVIIFATLISSARGQENIVMFKRRINEKLIKQSLSLLIAYLIIILTATLIIGSYENYSLMEILFEVVSAIGTVGLSLGLTGTCAVATKIIIIILMYIGRLGALTLFDLLLKDTNDTIVEKPEGKVLVG
ncbi:MAG: Trk family potassium uptake protein [Bacilli bacterium]|nr:Trk family potassium uptake protein [Bacilli bacterium]